MSLNAVAHAPSRTSDKGTAMTILAVIIGFVAASGIISPNEAYVQTDSATIASCVFDNQPKPMDAVAISVITPGQCHDTGVSFTEEQIQKFLPENRLRHD